MQHTVSRSYAHTHTHTQTNWQVRIFPRRVSGESKCSASLADWLRSLILCVCMCVVYVSTVNVSVCLQWEQELTEFSGQTSTPALPSAMNGGALFSSKVMNQLSCACSRDLTLWVLNHWWTSEWEFTEYPCHLISPGMMPVNSARQSVIRAEERVWQ